MSKSKSLYNLTSENEESFAGGAINKYLFKFQDKGKAKIVSLSYNTETELSEKIRKKIRCKIIKTYDNWMSTDKLKEYETSINYNYANKITNLNIPACHLRINFELAQPYFSKDDDPLYFIDNPICKEHIFKIPMVRPSTWKGLLRGMGVKIITDSIIQREEKDNSFLDSLIEKRLMLVRLFGDEKDVVKTFLDLHFNECNIAGRDLVKEFEKKLAEIHDTDSFKLKGSLNFFATYFKEVKYDVINKLNDATRTGSGPIFYEIAAEDQNGTLQIIYTPIGKAYAVQNKCKTYQDELSFLAECLSALLIEYGFSAKGDHWGIIKNLTDDQIQLTFKNIFSHKVEKERDEFVKKFKEKFRSDDNE